MIIQLLEKWLFFGNPVTTVFWKFLLCIHFWILCVSITDLFPNSLISSTQQHNHILGSVTAALCIMWLCDGSETTCIMFHVVVVPFLWCGYITSTFVFMCTIVVYKLAFLWREINKFCSCVLLASVPKVRRYNCKLIPRDDTFSSFMLIWHYYFLPSFSRLPLISYIQRASIITFWCRCGQSRAAWAPWPAPSWPTSSGPRTATPSVPSETVWARINASLCRTNRVEHVAKIGYSDFKAQLFVI